MGIGIMILYCVDSAHRTQALQMCTHSTRCRPQLPATLPVDSTLPLEVTSGSVCVSLYGLLPSPAAQPCMHLSLCADVSGKIRIWDTTQMEHILKYEYQPISGRIKDIAWSPDSKRIAVCGEGREK